MATELTATVIRLLLIMKVLSVVNSEDQSEQENAINDDWQNFKTQHNKHYGDSMKDSERQKARIAHLELIADHNRKAAQGGHTYTLADNQLSGYSDAEYEGLLGYRDEATVTTQHIRRRKRSTSLPAMPTYSSTVNVRRLTSTVNWTSRAWVGRVMDQGMCGSCWAYAATGAMEAQFKNKTKVFYQLSEQNLIDCSKAQGNNGCKGGNTMRAFFYVRQAGLESLKSYPCTSSITGTSGSTCRYNSSKSVLKLSSWLNIEEGSEAALQQAADEVGPIAVAIDASSYSFQFYSSGVYSERNCSASNLNHAVLLCGYGIYNGYPYWLLKNSWGRSWGMQGYMMMARNAGNMCGVATRASFPTVGWTLSPKGR